MENRTKYIKGLPIDRFLAKIEYTTDCWLWTAGLKDGYGVFNCGDKTSRAHKWYWEYLYGAVKKGYELDHLCDNRACVNPNHLKVVTHAENVKRAKVGKRNWRTLKITHCPQGHLYSKENTYYPPNLNERHCKICRNERSALWRKKHIGLVT